MDDRFTIIVGTILVILIVVLVRRISSLKRINEIIKSRAESEVLSARSHAEASIASVKAKNAKDIEEIKKRHATGISLVKQECAKQIQHLVEDIESDKVVLSKKPKRTFLLK